MDYTELNNEELCILIQQGDAEAVDVLLEKNKKFIQFVAEKVKEEFDARRLVPNDDLLQCGKLALWESAKNLNPEDGKLTTYAHKHIRGAMIDEMKRYMLIKFRNDGDAESIKLIKQFQKSFSKHNTICISGGFNLEDNDLKHKEILTKEEYTIYCMANGEGRFTNYGKRTRKEIADLLNLTVPQVNRRYYAAKRKISDSFGEYDFWIGIPEDMLKEMIARMNRSREYQAKKYGWE